MLTEQEFEQIITAIETMESYRVNGNRFVSANNVKLILQKWTQTCTHNTRVKNHETGKWDCKECGEQFDYDGQ